MFATSKRSHSSILFVATLMLTCQPGLADEPTAGQNEQASQQESVAESEESLDVRYARAHLRLAKLDLYRFLAAHRETPHLVPMAAADELRRHVAIDEEQLKQALKGPDGDLHQIYIRSASIALDLAKADLERTQKAYQQFPTKTQATEVKRAEAVLDVVKLHVEVTKEQQSSLSSLLYLQWQIDVLRNQVTELQVQLKTSGRG